MAAEYDSGWDTSSLSNFAFTQIGSIAVKSRLQSVLVGPRIFFSTKWTDKHKLNPFGEAQFGVSHLSQKVTQVNVPSVSASDTAFSWMLGGGADYPLVRSRELGFSTDTPRKSRSEPSEVGPRGYLYVWEPLEGLHRQPQLG